VLVLCEIENRLYRLLFRSVDEAARIDDDDGRPVGVCHVRVPGAAREPQHDLCVDTVFGAAQTNEMDRARVFGHIGRGI
jgi:hypothetical protein